MVDRIIYMLVTLACDAPRAFEMFTVNEHLEKWLTRAADVEPRVGGKYELFWDPDDRENDSTIGCKVLALHPGSFLSFEWKGPGRFKHVMNEVRPLTNVAVSFIPYPEGTEVHLLHTGWGDTPEWEEARLMFEGAWAAALSELERHVEGEATDSCCD